MNSVHDRPDPDNPTYPAADRRVVATAADLPAAQRAIACLVDGGISQNHTDVVGRGLRPALWVAGRRSTPNVALRAGLLGALVGVLVGWLLIAADLVAPVAGPIQVTLSAAMLGAVFGASLGLMGYGLIGNRGSVAQPDLVQADHYDVLVDAGLVDDAVRSLQGGAPSEVPLPKT